MTESNAPDAGRIFISYRREETAYPAGWLYDRLADSYGGGQIFKDVDSIQLGDDFVEVITRAVGSCDVLLALIGDRWLTITDPQGRRRLDDPDDFVRLEIEAALARNVRVIPILVDSASMPAADELPPSLAALARRQALELSPAQFDFDTSRLLKVLDRTLAEVRAAAPDGGAAMPPPAARVADPDTAEVPASPERRELPKPSPIPTVLPADTAAPSELRKLPDKQHRRLSRRARILAAAGAGGAIVLLIVVVAANSGSPPAENGSSGVSTGSQGPSNASRIFEDDFSSQESGWQVTENGRGRYSNGAYRLAVPPSKDGSSPWILPGNASSVFPQGPPSLAVEVDARNLSGDQSTGYGIICRATENTGYALSISGDDASVAIYKVLGRAPWLKLLPDTEKSLPSGALDVGGKNRLRADCASAEGQAVDLAFSVNGQEVAEATDTEKPFSTGSVGLFVGVGEDAAAEAEFDNFVVDKY